MIRSCGKTETMYMLTNWWMNKNYWLTALWVAAIFGQFWIWQSWFWHIVAHFSLLLWRRKSWNVHASPSSLTLPQVHDLQFTHLYMYLSIKHSVICFKVYVDFAILCIVFIICFYSTLFSKFKIVNCFIWSIIFIYINITNYFSINVYLGFCYK